MEELLAKLAGNSVLTPSAMLSRLVLAFLLTSCIAALYSKNYRGYGRPNQLSLVLILVALATAGIIMAIGDNLALSLGMVGALSIVRFRAAIKDNRDLAYLFWALAVGLVCGTGAFLLALILTAFLGAVTFALERLDLFHVATRNYIIIISAQAEGAGDVRGLLPDGAELKSTVYHQAGDLEESTFLAEFSDGAALDRFKESARANGAVTRFQVLGPEDGILG